MNSKPFFVLLLFILFIIVFAGGAIGNTDLTPGTPSRLAGDQVTGPLTDNQPGASGPASSVCGASYTVRSGDTLSRIAQNCGVTLAQILAANPNISNPNLILVNQKIKMPFAPTATRAPKPGAAKTAVPPTPASTKPPAAVTTGFRPGDTFQVNLTGLPPNTEVNVGLGPEFKQPATIGAARTDASGALVTKIDIPGAARAGERWMASAWLPGNPTVRVNSEPFVITK